MQDKQTQLTRFLFELTIVGRSVWSNEELNTSEKVCGLKWINEINHRVLNALRSENDDLATLNARIQSHADQSVAIKFEVRDAWKRAAEKTSR